MTNVSGARHPEEAMRETCRLIRLPSVTDVRGSLSFIESSEHFPAPIRRVYYLTGVPEGERRGGHAHRRGQQLVIALAGSFDVMVDDGHVRMSFTLDRPDDGLFIPTGCWRELNNFSAGAVCLVLASEHYDADDYVRDYDEFAGSTPSRQ